MTDETTTDTKTEILAKLQERRQDVMAYGGYLPGSPEIKIFDRLIRRLEKNELTDQDANLIEVILNFQWTDEITEEVDVGQDTPKYMN
jgi:hypothetical protein